MSDIEVGVRLLEYSERVSGIMELLVEASASADLMVGCFPESGGVYEGRALSEIVTFCRSYAANVSKLHLLQSLTVGYLGRIFQEFVDTDEELAGVVAVWLGGGS